MSLQIPSYPDPTRTTPITDAYAFINGITINVGANRLQLDLLIYASAADYQAGAVPIQTLNVVFGNDGVPDLATFIQAHGASWLGLRTAFYAALANHPLLTGSTDVP